jgi:carbon-monoxide dehydrogenase large subunit
MQSVRLSPALNPLILHGQTHGGIAQGIGQALLEKQLLRLSQWAAAGSELRFAVPPAIPRHRS